MVGTDAQIMRNLSVGAIEAKKYGSDRELLDTAIQQGDEWFIEGYDTYTWYRAIANCVAPKCILELGVRFAYSGIAMLRGALESSYEPHYVGIDNEHDGVASNAIALRYLRALDKTAEIINADTCNHVLIDTELSLRGRLYDLIHLDANHSPEGIAEELTVAQRWVSENGVILVDDIDVPHIAEAVQQFCSAHGFIAVLIPTHHQLYLIEMNA